MSNRVSGRRYSDTPKLNIKKVFATILVFIVIILIVISIKNLCSSSNLNKTKDVSVLTTYFDAYENGKWGVIDNKGNTVIDFDQNEMIQIPNKNKGLFIETVNVDLNNGTYQTKVLDENNNQILSNYTNLQAIENSNGNSIWYEDNLLKFNIDGKYGLIDFDGDVILNAEYDNIYSLAGINKSIIIEKDGKKGLFLAGNNEIIISATYNDINALTNNYEDGFIVKDANNKVGIIAADKTFILECKYDSIDNVTGNNYYVVNINGEKKVIDNNGNDILSTGFDSIKEINGDNFIAILNNKYGLIKSSGEVIIPFEYDYLKYAFVNTYIAKQNNKYGVIDSNLLSKIEFKYEDISYISECNFFECEEESYTTDLIDSNFDLKLSSVIVSELNTEDGYMRIRIDDEYKYYNFKFEEKSNKDVLGTNTLFLVKENGKYGYVNSDGQKIVNCIYDDAKEQNEYGYCAVNQDGKWGAIGYDGTLLVEPIYDFSEYINIDFISSFYRFNDTISNIYTK